MASVIFTLALSHIGRAAGSVVSIAEQLPLHRDFELSQDGESLFSSNKRYEFVGFSDDGSFISDSGERMLPGRRLGHLTNDGGKVRQLNSSLNNYVMLYGVGDCAEVYRLCGV